MADKTSSLKFYSPDGTDIHVKLPDGRRAIVGKTPRELPAAFNRAAIREGALTTDMPSAEKIAGPAVPDASDPIARSQQIHDLINKALDAPEDDEEFADAFTRSGLPSVPWLCTKLGYKIDATERDQAWGAIQHEREGEEEEQGSK